MNKILPQSAKQIAGQIDFYCFPTKTGDETAFTDLSQYSNPYEKSYYERIAKEVAQAKTLGKLLLFNMRNYSFVDAEGNIVSIAGKTIFPRSTIQDFDCIMQFLEDYHGISISPKKDFNTVEHWFEKIQTKRGYVLTTRGEVEEHLDEYEKRFGKTFFIKTLHKGHSSTCMIVPDFFDDTKKMLVAIQGSRFVSINMCIEGSNTPVLVCKAVDIVRDDNDLREWRAFVINDQLYSLSRASSKSIPIEEYVYDQVNTQIASFKGIMPASYVVDFFEYHDGDNTTFEVVEFNPIICSGTYANNCIIL